MVYGRRRGHDELAAWDADVNLGPLLVMTPDLDAASDFYGNVLGLFMSNRTDNQLVFDLGATSLHVFLCENPAPPREHGSDAATVITFEVESLDEAVRALKWLGVVFLHDRPGRNEAVNLNYTAFEAPGGNIHELVQRDRPGGVV